MLNLVQNHYSHIDSAIKNEVKFVLKMFLALNNLLQINYKGLLIYVTNIRNRALNNVVKYHYECVID